MAVFSGYAGGCKWPELTKVTAEASKFDKKCALPEWTLPWASSKASISLSGK